jgi:hypothetical protein
MGDLSVETIFPSATRIDLENLSIRASFQSGIGGEVAHDRGGGRSPGNHNIDAKRSCR